MIPDLRSPTLDKYGLISTYVRCRTTCSGPACIRIDSNGDNTAQNNQSYDNEDDILANMLTQILLLQENLEET